MTAATTERRIRGGLIVSEVDADGDRIAHGHVGIWLNLAGDDWAVRLETGDRVMGRSPRLPDVVLFSDEGATAADLWRELARLAFAPPVAEDAGD